MNKNKPPQLEPDRGSRASENVMTPFRNLQQQLSVREMPEDFHRSKQDRSGRLLVESEKINTCMLEMDHFMSNGATPEQKSIDPVFRDDFFHLLVFTHLRLLALSNEISIRNRKLKGEIAQTHSFLRNSAKLLNRITLAENPLQKLLAPDSNRV